MKDGHPASAAAAIPAARHFGPVDSFVAIAMNLLMGMNLVSTKMVIGTLGPLSTSAIRLIVTFLICLPWLLRARDRWRMLACYGLLNGVGMTLVIATALYHSRNIGALAIVLQLAIPFSVILGVLFLRERVTLIRVGGTVFAFAGVFVMLFDPRIAEDLLGVCLMLVASLIWSTSSLLQRKLSGVPMLTFHAWTGVAAILVVVPAAFIFEPGIVGRTMALEWDMIGWLIFSIFFVSIIGNGLSTVLLRHHPVSVVMPLTLAVPVVAVIAAWLFLGAPITLSMVVGGVMVIGGVAAIMLFESARGRRNALADRAPVASEA